jgi:putative tricarboxylic transport membrane protein
MESNLRRALTISDGDWSVLFASPLSIGLWLIAVTGFVLPIAIGPLLRRRMAMRKDEEGSIVD